MTAIIQSERGYYLTRSQITERRRHFDADVWLFVKWVCKHGDRAVERFHRPLAYFLAGDAVHLAASLNAYKSELVSQIRADLTRRGIDWNTKEGIVKLARLLQRVNDRMWRSSSKTTEGLDVLLHAGSVDPNNSIGIASKSDPAAWGMCETIGNIMKFDEYAMYYPDRLHAKNPDGYITQSWIRMAGRTNPSQDTIEARGCTSQWYSRHYNIIYCDDLCSTEAKQGEATVEDALRFIASMSGLSMPAQWGNTRQIFNGTITGPKDDNTVLSVDPDVLSVRVPIWKKTSAVTLSNLKNDGIPVLPEWYDVDDCRRLRNKEINNPKFGPVSWLQNFELTAHEAGSMQFSEDLLRRSKFVWITKERSGGLPYRVMRRYLWNADNTPLRKIGHKSETCLCWLGCGLPDHGYVDTDPFTLPRVLGVDQSLALKGDKWSIGVVTRDSDGYVYQLKGASGKGYRNMIPAIPYVFKRWGGPQNPPRKVGIESNAWQAITTDWLRRGDTYAFLARRIVSVTGGMTSKEMRIFNTVLANMEMGTLLLDPEDSERDAEMLAYNASHSAPEDNIIDSIGIAMSLLTVQVGREDGIGELAEEMMASDYDPVTGVDLSTDFMECMWTS